MVTEEQLKNAFTLKIYNPRIVLLQTNSKMVTECKKHNKITELKHSSGVSLKINDEIVVNDILYKAEKIKKEITEDSKKSHYKIINYELSKTSQFILPLLGLTYKEVMRDTILCNAYIGYKDRDYGYFLYLLYRCDDEDVFNTLEENLLDLDLNMSTEFSDESFCMLKLELPKRFKKDIKILLQGKYSKISKEAKFCITQYYKANSKSLVHQILYRCNQRKKILEETINDILPENAELYSAFDEREIYM